VDYEILRDIVNKDVTSNGFKMSNLLILLLESCLKRSKLGIPVGFYGIFLVIILCKSTAKGYMLMDETIILSG